MRPALVCIIATACNMPPSDVVSMASPLADAAEVKTVNVCFAGLLPDGTEVQIGGVLYHVAPLHPATRAILFGAGISGGSGSFDPVARRFARLGYVAVRYDKPGGGARSPAPAGFGFSVKREDLSDLHAQVFEQLHNGRYTIGDSCPGATRAHTGFAQITYYGLSAGGAEGIEMVARHPDLPVQALIVSGSSLEGVSAAPAYIVAYANRQQAAGPVEYPRLAETTSDCENLLFDVSNVDLSWRTLVCSTSPVNRIPKLPLGSARTGAAQGLRNRTVNARLVLELGIPVLRVYGDHDAFLPGDPAEATSFFFVAENSWFTSPPRSNVRAADANAWERACRGETCPGCVSLEPCDVTLLDPLPSQTGHLSVVHGSSDAQVDAVAGWLAAHALSPTPRQ
jgi:pimeloyl-ACP methyl ester carboxylesterase